MKSPAEGGASARPWTALFVGLALAGAAAFGLQASGGAAARAWQAYLVNFVFWTAAAAGAVLLSAALTLTGAGWAGPLKRLAEAFSSFLPVSLILYGALWFGRAELFPALGGLAPARRLWLDPAFLFPRDGAALLLLAACGVSLAASSVRASRRETEGGPSSPRSQALATAYGVVYAVVLTLLAIDWIMSLDPRWTSTLLGGYYFVGGFYTGLAAVAVLAGLLGSGLGMQGGRSRDLGTLLLAFAFTTGYLFYVQFLVAWYGNLPAETQPLILRLRASPWAPLTWAVLAGGFAVPVAVLLFRRAKARPAVVAAVGGLVLAAMWLERFLLVAPSLSAGRGLPLGWPEALVTAGYAGLVGLCLRVFLKRFGPASPSEVPRGRG